MVRVVINESEITLFQNTDFPLSLNRQLVDFKELGSRSGDFSLTLKVPNSEDNRRALMYFDNLTESNKFRKGIDNSCTIFANNITILSGLFYITAVGDEEISGYVLAKVSSLSKLLDAFRLRDIQGLTYAFDGLATIQDNLNYHIINGASPEKVVLFGMVAYGNYFIANRWESGLGYPCSRYDSSEYGEKDVSPRQIFGNTTYFLNDNSNTQLDFRSIPPQVYVVAILKAIFRQIGYRLTGSWVNGQEARSLLMPFTSEKPYQYNYQNLIDSEFEGNGLIGVDVQGFIKYDITDEEYQVPTNDNYLQIVSNPIDFPTGVGSDPNAITEFGKWWTMIRIIPVFNILVDNTFSLGQNTFIAPIGGTYKIEYSFRINDIDTYDLLGVRVFRKAFGISKFKGNLPQNLDGFSTLSEQLNFGTACVHYVNLINSNIGDTFTDNGNLEIDLEDGEVLVFWISTTQYNTWTGTRTIAVPIKVASLPPFIAITFPYSNGSGDWLNAPGDVPNELSSILEVNNTNFKITLTGANSDVDIAPNLPDVKCVDFVKSFVSLFNLYLNVDDINKTVYMDSFKDFYLGNDLAIDITERTQLDSLQTSPSDMASDYFFEWLADDKDSITQKIYNYTYKSKLDVANSLNTIDSGVFNSTEIQPFNALIRTTNDFNNAGYTSLSTVNLPRLVSDANQDNLSNEIITDRYNFKPRLLWFDGFDPNASIFGSSLPIMHSGVNTTEPLAGVVKFKFRPFKELFFEYYKTYLDGLAAGYELSMSLSINEFLWNEMQLNKPVLYENVVYCIKEIKGYKPDGKNLSKITLFRCK